MKCPTCAFGHGQACPPPDLLETARGYIAAVEADTSAARDPRDQGGFLFAKTMADNPHHYAVRGRAHAHSRARGLGHEALFALIRDHHFIRRWHGSGYRTIELDGFCYWVVRDFAGPDSGGVVINRKPVESAGWDEGNLTLF